MTMVSAQKRQYIVPVTKDNGSGTRWRFNVRTARGPFDAFDVKERLQQLHDGLASGEHADFLVIDGDLVQMIGEAKPKPADTGRNKDGESAAMAS